MELDTMHVVVEHRFDSPIEAVWDLLTDVERMAGLGPEHVAAQWRSAERDVGAEFLGTNVNGDKQWQVPCVVIEWERPHRFGWVVGNTETPSSTWRYFIESADSGTVVRQSFRHGPGFSYFRAYVELHPDQAAEIVAGRAEQMRANMATTLAAAADQLLRSEPA